MILRSQRLMERTLTQAHTVKTMPNMDPEDHARMVKDYARMAYTLPIVMRASGLALGFAWLDEQNGPGPAQFRNDLQETLRLANQPHVSEHVAGIPNHKYIMLTRTAFQALEYYRRFAASVLGVHIEDLESESEASIPAMPQEAHRG